MTRKATANDLQELLREGAGQLCAALGIERCTQASIPIDGQGLRIALETDEAAPGRRTVQVGAGAAQVEVEVEVRASAVAMEAQGRDDERA